jgi:peptide/nickel transport system substrate-binding protein
MKAIRIMTGALLLVALAAALVGAQEIRNPDTFITGVPNSVETLDPQFMISTATTELSDNVYNSLLDHPNGDMGTLLPALSAEVPTANNGLIVIGEDGAVFITFPIRHGVKFHNGDILTPEDVEYTFKRAILVGALYENMSMLTSNLLGSGSFQALVDEVGYAAAFAKLDEAILVSDNNVVFRLVQPFVPFLGLMADSGKGMAILNKSWCIEQGCWPGTVETGENHMNLTMEDDPLFDKMMGTGPFQLSSWEPGERVVFDRFEEYWEGPAKIARVIRRIVPDPQTSILLLKGGDVDFISVGVANLAQVENAPGIRVLKDLPNTWLRKINFVFHIAEGSKYVGNGTLSEDGIPLDFFSDINLRKAFQYCFDWDAFINDVKLGIGLKPYGPVLVGFPTANPDNPQYSLDLEKAEEYFKLAWDGELWETGFRFTAPYSAGSVERQGALDILKLYVEAINPKFHIDTAALPWASYVGAFSANQMPLSLMGLLPTVFDPYFPLFSAMHSALGGYAENGGYTDLAKERYDALIEELGSNYDTARREELSHELQRLYYEDSLAICYYQMTANVAMRDWVQGYYVGPFPTSVDFYTISKGY